MNLKQFLQESKDSDIELFKKLVNNHDMTFVYSDDARHYNKGRDQIKKIMDLKQSLIEDDPDNEEKIIEIWNNKIDKTFSYQEDRNNWYWKKHG